MRWVPGVSIGEEGGTFWPWHRNREEWFTIGHHRIGANVVLSCLDCGLILAAPPGAKDRKAAAVKQHDSLHRQINEMQDLVDRLYEYLGIDPGDNEDDSGKKPESGYIEPGYDVREASSDGDSSDEG